MTSVYSHYYKPSLLFLAFRLGECTSVEPSFCRLLSIETADKKIVLFQLMKLVPENYNYSYKY